MPKITAIIPYTPLSALRCSYASRGQSSTLQSRTATAGTSEVYVNLNETPTGLIDAKMASRIG